MTIANAQTPTPAPIFAVIYQTTNIRAGADTRFEIVGQLAPSDRVQVIGRDDDAVLWLFIVTSAGLRGWIPGFAALIENDVSAASLPLYAPESTPQSTVTASSGVFVVAYGRVNIRSAPSISAAIIGQLDIDDEVQVFARSSAANDWLLIETDMIEGWVAYFTVRVSGDLESLPVLVPEGSDGALIQPSTVLRSLFNIRLHTEPLLDSPTLLVVPFGRSVTLIARTEDERWLYVDYNGIPGWGVAELFAHPADLSDIPIYNPAQSTSEATAEVTLSP